MVQRQPYRVAILVNKAKLRRLIVVRALVFCVMVSFIGNVQAISVCSPANPVVFAYMKSPTAKASL